MTRDRQLMTLTRELDAEYAAVAYRRIAAAREQLELGV
jgi:hypothetical protein